MADISLTASMRSNLLSLQNTQSLMDATQERLSTGKKVNSAIDNPSSYYTAQSLNNRADDLNALLDSMGQGIQTLQATNEAIESITSFAEQAKAIANSARDVPSNFDKYAISSQEINAGVDGTFMVDARDDLSQFDIEIGGSDTGKEFTVYFEDGTAHPITVTGNDAAGAADVANKLQGLGLNAKVEGSKVHVSTTDGSMVSWINDDGNGLAKSASAAKSVTLTSGGNGANSASIAQAINDAASGLGVTAEADGKKLAIMATDKEFRVFADTTNDDVFEKLGMLGDKGAGNAKEVSPERSSYAKQFNEILSQIDDLANDAGYKGVNLLQENKLTVIFNEDRSSKIEITGVDASSKGLGIAQAQNDWQKDANIDVSITHIENAIQELRTMASDFGNHYSIVQTREDFADNIINVLTEGADNLTLADMNEESANMLALQTRQQLAINSLSLASQASQSVLQLF